MNCPACDSNLERTQYEGLPVFRCAGCRGYLVASHRIDDINRRQTKQQLELIQDASVAAGNDSRASLDCPRCRKTMNKQPLKPSHEFCVDECQECEIIWFDAGELAIIQLEHDASPGATSAKNMKQRVDEMTPEEIAEFEKNLANLHEGDATFLAGIKHGLVECYKKLFSRL